MTDTDISPLDKARILSEALPHMQEYDEETIVIKYGGHAMGHEDTAKAFARDIVLLEQTAINPVVVHGGGPQIATMLKRLGIKSEFADGLRITPRPLHGALVETYNDHRMAMSLALVGLKVPGVVIKDPGCVAKTYPDFFSDLEKLRHVAPDR